MARLQLDDVARNRGVLGRGVHGSCGSGVEVEDAAESLPASDRSGVVGRKLGSEQSVVEALMRPLDMVVVDVLLEDVP